MNWELWVAIAALVLAVAGLVVGLVVWRAVQQRTPAFVNEEASTPDPRPHPGPPVVVFNPSKGRDRDRVRSLVAQVASEVGLPEPLWLETTVEDPGGGQTREALRRGASVVVAVGGDGTIRAVAEVLAGGSTPMAVLPMGTGNLLARNLDLPLFGIRDMVTIALTGRDRPMDLGWLRVERPVAPEDAAAEAAQRPPGADEEPVVGRLTTDESDTEHVFLVIGGMGFDAAMVAGVDDKLKDRIGWIAYFVAGVKHLVGRKIHASIEIGGSPASAWFHARTVLVANCGRLPGGMVLFPEAQLDDGWLDIAAIDTRGGIIGWLDLLRKVVLQGLGIRTDLLPYSTGTLEFRRSQTVTIRTERPEQLQVDGDLLGAATAVHARVQHGGLMVRTS